MTNEQKFVELAVEGGWNFTDKELPYPIELKLKVFRASYKGSKKELYGLRAVTDPLAWAAVGKVKGWDTDEWYYNNMADFMERHKEYAHQMHRFFDLLIEGNDINSALALILK